MKKALFFLIFLAACSKEEPSVVVPAQQFTISVSNYYHNDYFLTFPIETHGLFNDFIVSAQFGNYIDTFKTVRYYKAKDVIFAEARSFGFDLTVIKLFNDRNQLISSDSSLGYSSKAVIYYEVQSKGN